MLKLGADRRHLQAKAFGGGNVLVGTASSDNYNCVGSVNVQFIRGYLDEEGIPLLSSSLGGRLGRIIQFHTGDFSVMSKEISRTQQKEVVGEERGFWKAEIQKQDDVTNENVELW